MDERKYYFKSDPLRSKRPSNVSHSSELVSKDIFTDSNFNWKNWAWEGSFLEETTVNEQILSLKSKIHERSQKNWEVSSVQADNGELDLQESENGSEFIIDSKEKSSELKEELKEYEISNLNQENSSKWGRN